jgi:hypothetical protein
MPPFSISIFVPEPQFHPFLYPLRYWFFLPSLLHFSHALLSQQPSPPLGTVAYFGISAPFRRHRLHRLGGLFHSRPLLCLRLLLRLRAFQDFRRLHKNVRTPQIRFPLVGHHLRQAARHNP